MKKKIQISHLMFFAAVTFIGLNSCTNNTRSSAANSTSSEEPQIDRNPIEGAWYLVWGEYGGAERKESEPFQIKLFTEGHFSYLMKSTSGEWENSAAGTYELKNGIYSEKHLHSTNADNIGLVADWTYELKGDSLFMNGPVTVVDAEGNEVPANDPIVNSMKEIRIRAN